jgi:hypothetical protein
VGETSHEVLSRLESARRAALAAYRAQRAAAARTKHRSVKP